MRMHTYASRQMEKTNKPNDRLTMAVRGGRAFTVRIPRRTTSRVQILYKPRRKHTRGVYTRQIGRAGPRSNTER